MLEDRNVMSHTDRPSSARGGADRIRSMHAERLRSFADRLPTLPSLFA